MSGRRRYLIWTAVAAVALALVLIRFPRSGQSAPSRANDVIKAGPQPRGPASPGVGGPETKVRPSRELPVAEVPRPGALPGQPAMFPPKLSELATTSRSPLADRLGAVTTLPAQEPRILLDVLDAYRRSFGSYPAGEDNRQIVNALLGSNTQKMPFIPSDHPRLNASGEVVDAWGTPFFFHLLSHDSIEVRSAGADRVMYSADDIVVGTPVSKPPRPVIPEAAPGS
jgi:hypothetical protein